MRKFIVLLVVVVLGNTQLFASDNNTISSEQELRNEVASLLESPQIKVEREELSANIEFTLNSNGEIVVLLVKSNSNLVKNYVKSRLNYKKINSEITENENRVYKLTLKIKSPQNS